MTTTDAYDDDLFMEVIRDFLANFKAGGWEGPDYRNPTESGHGDWEVFVVKNGEPNSWDPEEMVDVYARLRIPVKAATTVTVKTLAHDFSIVIAGRAAHEALECCRYRGTTRINPHDEDVTQVEIAAEGIRRALINGVQGECGP